MNRTTRWLPAGVLLGLLGCSGGGRLTAPELSPEHVAAAALAEYDGNKDGYVDAKELEHCPALKNSLPAIDKDNDGRISAGEISDRLAFYKKVQMPMMAVGCDVTLEGKALANATVAFVPEKFMGPELKAATGVSGKNGTVELRLEGTEMPGAYCGFYRVTISRKNAQGQESLPARYNTQTTLGQEVAPDLRGNISFPLTSKASSAAPKK
jgi:hypothetical protein